RERCLRAQQRREPCASSGAGTLCKPVLIGMRRAIGSSPALPPLPLVPLEQHGERQVSIEPVALRVSKALKALPQPGEALRLARHVGLDERARPLGYRE